MSKILVIGSAVADVIIRLEDHLPVKGEDVHVLSQEMRLGGCALNVYDMIRHFGEDAVPFLPIGSGPYADFVAKSFQERGIVSAVPRPGEANGCCYCFIEADGERTFIVYHGAEYRFRKEWFDALDTSEIDMCYICGLEIEETTGPVIVDFLEQNPHIRIFFAPGPRILKIDRDLMRRIFALHPILHLNQEETRSCAMLLSGQTDGVPSASAADLSSFASLAASIYHVTRQTVITTLGKNGCMYYTGGDDPASPKWDHIPGCPATQVDANGAGDAHAGAVIAQLHAGVPLPEALQKANLAGAMVVSSAGTLLSDKQFEQLTCSCG